VNWEAGGGGAFAVIPLEERGKLPDQLPLFRGHTAVVLDTDWSPFDDSLIASASDDGKVFLWQVPEDFALRTEAEEIEDVAPIGKLSGHSRCVWIASLGRISASRNASAQMGESSQSKSFETD
jgi:coronin-1B/1C/6